MRSIVRIIDMGTKAISSVAFGGPNRDILFVLASSQIANVLNFQPIEVIPNGSSLYTVTGLCATGLKSTRAKIPTPCKGC